MMFVNIFTVTMLAQFYKPTLKTITKEFGKNNSKSFSLSTKYNVFFLFAVCVMVFFLFVVSIERQLNHFPI